MCPIQSSRSGRPVFEAVHRFWSLGGLPREIQSLLVFCGSSSRALGFAKSPFVPSACGGVASCG